MKKKILLLTLALSIFLVACGKKEEKPVEETAQNSVETEVETEAKETEETEEKSTEENVEANPVGEVEEPTEEEQKIFEDFQSEFEKLTLSIAEEAAKAEDPAKAIEAQEEKLFEASEKLLNEVLEKYNITKEQLEEILVKVSQFELSKAGN